MITMTMMLDMG